MNIELLAWFVGFAIVFYLFDKVVEKYISSQTKDPEIFSETGVEDESNNENNSNNNSSNDIDNNGA